MDQQNTEQVGHHIQAVHDIQFTTPVFSSKTLKFRLLVNNNHATLFMIQYIYTLILTFTKNKRVHYSHY